MSLYSFVCFVGSIHETKNKMWQIVWKTENVIKMSSQFPDDCKLISHSFILKYLSMSTCFSGVLSCLVGEPCLLLSSLSCQVVSCKLTFPSLNSLLNEHSLSSPSSSVPAVCAPPVVVVNHVSYLFLWSSWFFGSSSSILNYYVSLVFLILRSLLGLDFFLFLFSSLYFTDFHLFPCSWYLEALPLSLSNLSSDPPKFAFVFVQLFFSLLALHSVLDNSRGNHLLLHFPFISLHK